MAFMMQLNFMYNSVGFTTSDGWMDKRTMFAGKSPGKILLKREDSCSQIGVRCFRFAKREIKILFHGNSGKTMQSSHCMLHFISSFIHSM